MDTKISNLDTVLEHRNSSVSDVKFATYDIDHKCLGVSGADGKPEFHDIDRDDISIAIIEGFLLAGANVRISDYDTCLVWLNPAQ